MPTPNGLCVLTPGFTVGGTDPITAADLNALGRPTVQVGDKQIGKRQVDRPSLVELLGDELTSLNLLDNGGFATPRWNSGTTGTIANTNKITVCDAWSVKPIGASTTWRRLEPATDAPPDSKSIHGLELRGNTSLTSIELSQNIPGYLAARAKGTLVLSWYMQVFGNAEVATTAKVESASALDYFLAPTTVVTTQASPVQPGAWTKQTVVLDTATANLNNGAILTLSFTAGLTNASNKVWIAQIKLELNEDGIATAFVPQREIPLDARVAALNGSIAAVAAETSTNTAGLAAEITNRNNAVVGEASARASADTTEATTRAAADTALSSRIAALTSPVFNRLKLEKAGAASVSVNVDGLLVQDATNGSRTVSTSGTINLGTTGVWALDTGTVANGNWYYVHIIHRTDFSATAAIASLSSTAPTLPSGYSWKGLVGEFYYTSDAVRQFVSNGRRVVYDGATTYSQALIAANDTNVSWAVAQFIPPTNGPQSLQPSIVHLRVRHNTGTTQNWVLRLRNSTGGSKYVTAGANSASIDSIANEFPVTVNSVVTAIRSSVDGTYVFACDGYER